MLQIRNREEPNSLLYSPGRDIAHCFNPFMDAVYERIQAQAWDYLTDLARREGVTDEDLGQVAKCLSTFIGTQMGPKESMNEALVRSEFLALPAAPRAIVMAYLGTVVLGAHWAGVRHASLGGKGPAETYRRLFWAGRKCVLLMSMPRWRRRLYTVARRVRVAWRTLWRK